jgi:D-serine deaminase-like pyridoxal phosphate-dependent protein
VTRSIHDVETPAVLVDLDILERNITRMADAARRCGVRLRPHAKTHKVLEVGRMQLAAGACGLCLAKPGEAEVFAAAGFDDIFLAYPIVGADKARRLLALGDRVRLAVGADSVEGASTLADAFHAAGRRIEILLKVDVGSHRVGVPAEDALEMARRLADLRGLRLRGVFAHSGLGYHSTSPEAVAEAGQSEGRIMAEVAETLRGEGILVEEVSVGSTPTALSAMAVDGVTECRPGTYVYQDASQVSLGTCALEDCALTVLATVVSAPAHDRAVVDAGSKTLSSDPLRPQVGGHGWIVGRQSRVQRLSEEHGVIDLVEGESLRVGERVRILPNHACVVSNLHDEILAVRGDRVEAVWKVAARGRVQ